MSPTHNACNSIDSPGVLGPTCTCDSNQQPATININGVNLQPATGLFSPCNVSINSQSIPAENKIVEEHLVNDSDSSWSMQVFVRIFMTSIDCFDKVFSTRIQSYAKKVLV